ncbi:MAG: ComF family protein [Lachnospiraceae bacterium]|nr:ComF family protein [Lachnospiraceae bacterium]
MHRLDILFPACCPICLKPVHPKGSFIHEACRRKLKFVESPFCMKCGRGIADEGAALCSSCKKGDFVFDSGRCTFAYHSDIGNAIKWVKDEGTREFIDFFGDTAAKRHETFLKAVKPEIIVPVPLSESRLRARGFNQSELFAESLAGVLGIPVGKLLKKVRNTRDQKGLNRRERTRNLAGAFEAVSCKEMPERVLLTDDIYTTGSTVNACAAVLKAAGVKEVYFICIAAGTADD